MANTPRRKAPKTRIVDIGDLNREFRPGTLVDRYEIVATLGSGGCGVVYAARHVHLNQTVALKLLHQNLISSEERVERFFREARAAAAVGNPHIVRVSDCGVTSRGIPFLAMEFLKGVVLENLLDGTYGLPLDQAVDIGLQMLDGLQAAHSAGVVHRDLKPENIFLVPDPETGNDFVKILDFGVSKMIAAPGEKVLTSTGALLGTPRYMAPEQFRGARNVDHRADIFAAAVVLFQMLSGKLPFEGDNPLVLAHRAATQPPRPLHELIPNLPDDVCGVIYQGLAKNPDERWQHARAFGEALRTAYASSAPAVEPDDMELDRPTDVSDDDRTTESSDTFRAKIDPAVGLEDMGFPSPDEVLRPLLKDPLDVDLDDQTLPTGTTSLPVEKSSDAARDDLSFEVEVDDLSDEGEGTLDGIPFTPTRATNEPAISRPSSELDITPKMPAPAFKVSQDPQPGSSADADEKATTLPWGRRVQPSVDPLAETSEAEPASSGPQPPNGLRQPPLLSAGESIEPGPAMVQPLSPSTRNEAPPSTPSSDQPFPGPAHAQEQLPSEQHQVADVPAPMPTPPQTSGPRSWRILVVLFGLLSLVGGVILGFVLLSTGWFDAPPPQPTPARASGVVFSNIQIDGALQESAINAALASARPHMEMCRGPEPAQITLEVHISPPGFGGDDRLSLVRPLPADADHDVDAQCCVDAFRAGLPRDWSPGDSGVVSFEITLPQR